jgi:hypothetical protein
MRKRRTGRGGDEGDEGVASGADILATLLQAPPPQHVALKVENFTLGSPDFATPKLTSPVTPLSVQNYTLGPLQISVPDWCVVAAPAWCVGRFHVVWDVGRRPDIPDDVKERMITDLVVRLTQMRIERPSRALYRSSKVVVDYVRELAQKEKIPERNRLLRKQIINPAFDRWETLER